MSTPPTLDITAYGETFTVTPSVGQYEVAGRLAIRLFDEEGPYATVTINLPDEHLNPGEVFVKDYAENEAAVLALIGAGWLEYTHREVQAGFVIVPVARLAGALAAYVNEQAS